MNDPMSAWPQDSCASEQKARQELVGQLIGVQDAERLRISRDLHDETGQTLTALGMVLEMLHSEPPEEVAQLRERLWDAMELARLASEQLHAVIQDLRPTPFDLLGLKSALEEHCRAFQHYTRISIHTAIDELPDLPDRYGITFYRCLQEALTNAARHGHARQIWVGLRQIEDQWVMSVKDDGCGLSADSSDPTTTVQQLGLVGLRERLQIMGGSLQIHSQDGQGTLLLARLPAPEPGPPLAP
jgi:signal transduction histidine kinase